MLFETSNIKNEAVFERHIPKMVSKAIIEKDSSELLKAICKNIESFYEWVIFSNSFDRSSETFKAVTTLHLEFRKNSIYSEYYDETTKKPFKRKNIGEIYPDLQVYCE